MSQVEPNQTGVSYWRSLEQLADTPQVRELIEREFPGYDPSSIARTSRRRLLKLMGASLALAGLTLTGCRRWPQEKLAPYTGGSGNFTPGVPEAFATTWEVGGVGRGLLVSSFNGRPIKIEGNPSHPFSRVLSDNPKLTHGATDAFSQASLLEMYDPQRSRVVLDRQGKDVKESTWEAFGAFAAKHFANLDGASFAILSEASSSPSVIAMRRQLQAKFKNARWYDYEPLTRDAEVEGAKLAFGAAVRTRHHLDKAQIVVSLDEDFMMAHPASLRNAADWAAWRRKADQHGGKMNRVFVAETAFTVTGSVADVRLPVNPARLEAVARAIAIKIGVAGVAADSGTLSDAEAAFVNSAAADLDHNQKSGLIMAGPSASPATHALCHTINAKIQAIGNTVTLHEDPAADQATSQFAGIKELAGKIRSGEIKTLLVLGGNPAYDAPFDVDFAGALKQPGLVSIRLGLYNDETSRLSTWHLPRAHYLEAWGDARAWDGTASIAQPLIEPLFGGKSVIELLALLCGDELLKGRGGDQSLGERIVRRTWKAQFITEGDFDKEWRKSLSAGFRDGTAFKVKTAEIKLASLPAQAATEQIFLRFTPDSHVYDGRFANNGWLQETGDPLTKLTWDNAAIVSKIDADKWGVKHGDVIRIDTKARSIEVAAFIMPGQPVGVVSLSLGYGRTASGSVGDRLGFNAYAVRPSDKLYVIPGVTVTRTGQTYSLATTSEHHILDEFAMKNAIEERIGRKGQTGTIVREATIDQYKKNPRVVHGKDHGAMSLQLFDPPSKFNDPNAWGMAIDLNTCIGCNACVVACQAENNVPVVGKDQVLMHREMQWLRIDRYFKGNAADPNPQIVYQPMMCVHCENAPCEQVCPVAATVHDTEGLNTMVYNRCIGTRYCSNNCPYKVRRFNYFDYHSKDPRTGMAKPYLNVPDQQQLEQVDQIKRMIFNPEVTVRMRGVMEKCTYCTQRLSHTKINKRNNGQDTLADGDVMTACQQVCPTQAIVFGNLNQKKTDKQEEAGVVTLHKNPRAYDVLGELNVRPRTKYLAKLRNPSEKSGGGHA